MNEQLLSILRCPVSKQKLKLLDDNRFHKLIDLIQQGEVKTHDGENISTLPQQALICENENTIYMVIDNIPVMLEDKSINNTFIKI